MNGKKSGMALEYQLLLDNSQEIILFFDSTGRIINCNAVAREELGYGDNIFKLPISGVFKDVFQYDNNYIITDPKYLNCLKESTAYRKNQTCFPVNLTVAVTDINNKFMGICTAVNITDKKRCIREIYYLKKELNSSDLISSELVAKVAHELRTPLNGIMGFISNLMDTELNPDQLEAVNIINKCSSNLNSLVNELMDFAKISNRKLFIEPKEFGFHEFIHHIIDINNGKINEKGLKFLLFISDEIPDRLIGDELRLGQILNNLFANAIKFTSVGQISLDIVKVVQTEKNIELLFMLTDTGIGFDMVDRDKLFKSFSQIDNLITRKYGGTGLGLSICKSLVEMMGGKITVDSEKNKGSTFSFTVQLGLLKEEGLSIVAEKRNFDNDYEVTKEAELLDVMNKDTLDIDYVSRKLQNIAVKKRDSVFVTEKSTALELNDLLEQLLICIEMENWEKSEQLAYRIRSLQFLDSRDMLRLLLTIRREDHDMSLTIINELKQYVSREEK